MSPAMIIAAALKAAEALPAIMALIGQGRSLASVEDQAQLDGHLASADAERQRTWADADAALAAAESPSP